LTAGLVAVTVPSLYYMAVIVECVGKVYKAKSKYLKLMYITALENHATRTSYVAIRISFTNLFVVSAFLV